MSPANQTDRPLEIALLCLRLSVFLVMFMWTVDKFINPAHATAVYANFYFLEGLGHGLMYAIGAAEMFVLAGFLLGIYRKLSYGAVLALHAVSTLSAWVQYFDPFTGPNLLFFAAWPMLAACLALFLLRDRDRLATLGGRS